MQLKKYVLFLLTILLSTACLQEEIKPQEPLWGKEGCARCRMVLSEKRYAVQRLFPNGEVHYYDDIICALKHNHAPDEGTLYVRPHEGNEWVQAKDARYLSGLMTPMNSGFGAVKEGGAVGFDEIVKKFEGH